MWRNNKKLLAFGLLAAFALVAAACTSDDAVSDDAQAEIDALMSQLDAAREEGSDAVADLEAALAAAQAAGGEEVVAVAEGECCDVYRIGIFEDPITTNYWSYLGPDNSVWTGYILGNTAGSLYTLSDQRNDVVTSLAADLDTGPVQEGDLWTITVDMVAMMGSI